MALCTLYSTVDFVFVGMQVNAAAEDFISTVISMTVSGASNGAVVELC